MVAPDRPRAGGEPPLWALSLGEAVRAIREGRTTSRAVLDACLARIDATEPLVQAWALLDRAGAREAADRQDLQRARRGPSGALDGVPVGLKDIFDVAGLPTRAGAGPFAETRPTRDSAVAARLRAAGALILGKLHTTEFAHLDPAPTRNPWHLDRTPGGSSSGSAAAVAARMVAAALGSQTVGSTIRPAAFCGVVGLKPRYGRIGRRGMVPGAWSLDHVGLLTRTVADAALLLSVLAGAADRHGSAPPSGAGRPSARPPRLGLVTPPLAPGPGTAAMADHVETVAGRLGAAGARLEAVVLPTDLGDLVAAVRVVVHAEVAAYHEERHRRQAGEYRPGIRAAIEVGAAVPAGLYLRAQRIRARFRAALLPLLGRFDALLLPAATGAAPDRGSTGDPSLNAPWSGIGVPQIALPSGRDPDGLPLAIQLVSAAEAPLLAAARWAEAVIDFRDQPLLTPP